MHFVPHSHSKVAMISWMNNGLWAPGASQMAQAHCPNRPLPKPSALHTLDGIGKSRIEHLLHVQEIEESSEQIGACSSVQG